MFAIKIVQPEGHHVAAGVYVAELLRQAASRVETQQVIEEGYVLRHDNGEILYEWTTQTAPPPEPEPEVKKGR